MKKLRWGVIGAGGIADRRTIPGMMLAENAELIAVMDINAGQVEKIRQKYGAKRGYTKEEDIPKKKPWALVGHKDQRDRNVIKSLQLKQELLEEEIMAYWPKYERAQRELPEYEARNLDKAEVVFVAYGSTARVVLEAMEILQKEGIETGLIRPKTLWPFPDQAFENLGDNVKKVISVELSQGQMINDVKLALNGRYHVDLINRVGGMLLSPAEIAERTKTLMGGTK